MQFKGLIEVAYTKRKINWLKISVFRPLNFFLFKIKKKGHFSPFTFIFDSNYT